MNTKLSSNIEINDNELFIYSNDRKKYTKITGESIELCCDAERDRPDFLSFEGFGGLHAQTPTPYEPYETCGKNLFDNAQIIMSPPPKFGKCNVVENETGIVHPYPMWLSDDSADALNYCVNDIMNTKKLEEKEGINMDLLKLYNKKSIKNINMYYDKLVKEERENDVVEKEYNAILDKFLKDLQKLIEKYNVYNKHNGSYLEEDEDFACCDNEEIKSMLALPAYFVHDETEKEHEIETKRQNELHQLEENIEELNAHFCLMPPVETDSHDQVMKILKAYGVVDENGKLTPYTPEAIGDACCEECKCEEIKHRGRPKKESN